MRPEELLGDPLAEDCVTEAQCHAVDHVLEVFEPALEALPPAPGNADISLRMLGFHGQAGCTNRAGRGRGSRQELDLPSFVSDVQSIVSKESNSNEYSSVSSSQVATMRVG